MKFRQYVKNLLIAVDQLANAVAFGDPDETISSRAAKAKKAGELWGCYLCRVLHVFEKNHCEKSVELDEGQRQ